MKNIVINIHNNSKTIATHHLDINDKKPLIIHAKPHLNYEFLDAEMSVSPNHIVTKRAGNDLGVLLNNEVKDAGILIIKDFYKYPNNALIGLAENKQYYYYIPDTGEVADYVTQLTDNKSSGLALGGDDGFSSPWWKDNSHTKARKSLKAIFKSIISDEPSTQEVATTEISVKEHSSKPITDTVTTKTAQVYNSKTHKFTEVEAKEDSIFDNIEVAPLVVGVGMGLGTIALFSKGGDSEKDDNSAKGKHNYIFTGTEKDNELTGSDENDNIQGLAGNDTLTGGKGSDTLTGGKGNDVFAYKLSDFTDKKSVDEITDFNPKEDKIQLPKELFKSDKVADNLTDYIKYDKSTGELSYDSDGKGGDKAVVFATLTNHADLTVDSDTFQIV